MNKLFFSLILSALLVFPVLAKAEVGSVTFVSSEASLEQAINNKNIKGVAIRAEFYNAAEPALQAKIDRLVADTLTNNLLQPAFIYGLIIKKETLKLLFGDVEFTCNGLIMAGVFPSVVISGSLLQATIPMCGGMDELYFQDWLIKAWQSEKQFLESQGIATPKKLPIIRGF